MCNPLQGLVLAGGHSKRMGRDKGDLVYFDKPQKFHLADMLRELGMPAFISQRKGQSRISGYDYITDREEVSGPMAGLYAALHHASTPWLVVGCDYPYIQKEHLACLIENRNREKLATCYRDSKSGFRLPTLCIYEPGILPYLKNVVADGDYSLNRLLSGLPISELTASDKFMKSVDYWDDFVAFTESEE